jgi:outer membrane protein assembly factor BamB
MPAPLALALVFLALLASSPFARGQVPKPLHEVVRESGIRGGLIVHLGATDAGETAALRLNERFMVQGLERDARRVAQARKRLLEQGLLGAVTVVHWRGERLPYADNLVNLVVTSGKWQVASEEIARVLAPGGVAVSLDSRLSTLDSFRKPWPQEIDEWTHFLHGPDNNAVAEDTRVRPPRHIQWVAGPRWGRSHDHLASMSAAVSASGRMFYIVDEGPVASVSEPSRWMLVARDAFNGVLLWKKEVGPWEDQLRPFRSGPAELPRRLVAVNDRVYVTLGYGKPVNALDAATGDVVHTYAGTENTHEILYYEGKLYLVISDPLSEGLAKESGTTGEVIRRLPPWRDFYSRYVTRYLPKQIQCLQADTGQFLWKKKDADTEHVLAITLAVDDGRVLFENEKEIMALAANSGKLRWRAARPVALRRYAWSSPTLVVKDGVVLSADRSAEANLDTGGEEKTKLEWLVTANHLLTGGEMMAFSAETGEKLWTVPCHEGFNFPVDVFVAQGKVWSGELAWGRQPGLTKVYDLHTGEVVAERPPDQKVYSIGFGHARCYRNKATTQYVLHGRSGVEFLDMSSNRIIADHWIRGTCQYGILPCNGLLYVPPHSCACYTEAKLNSFNALAAERAEGGEGKAEGGRRKAEGGDLDGTGAAELHESRLERGRAYIAVKFAPKELRAESRELRARRDLEPGRPDRDSGSPPSAFRPPPSALSSPPSALRPPPSSHWPTYRHDVGRSGAAGCSLSPRLELGWEKEFPGPLTSVVIADGRLLFAQEDTHTVHALNAMDGSPLWLYSAGGRVDSPPTVHGGFVYFGSADGWVYCLRAADGALAWRFRAAPETRQIVSYGQLESVWPLHGNVLVHQGQAPSSPPRLYTVAGRSSFLDGGLFFCALNARTGELLSEQRISHRDPNTGLEPQDTVRGVLMPGALPDILATDGSSLFMRHLRLDMQGKPLPQDVDHLFSSVGFLDDDWWHRTYWQVGTTMLAGYGGWPQIGNRRISGRLLVLGEGRVFGYGRREYGATGSHVALNADYHLFAADRNLIQPKPPEGEKQKGRRPRLPATKVNYHWSRELPFFARAMLLAGDTLLAAGPSQIRDVASASPKGDVWLWAVSAADGTKKAEYKLKAPPVFDSLAAAGGRLYFTTVDGRVVCYRQGG